VERNNRGNVDAYNYAAYHSSADSDVLVQVQDDVEPPEAWDAELDQRLDPSAAQVLHVADGLPPEVNDKPWLMAHTIGTRKWFKQCGYFWHPDYVSVYCDDDFSKSAAIHGEIVDALDLEFTHKWQGKDHDETQRRSYSKENWKLGKEVFERRNKEGFPLSPELWEELAPNDVVGGD
jgi:hypothetical protein